MSQMLAIMILLWLHKSEATASVNISKISNDSIFVDIGTIHLGNPTAALIVEFSLKDLSHAVAEVCACTDGVKSTWKTLQMKSSSHTTTAEIIAAQATAERKCAQWRLQIEHYYGILINRSPYMSRDKRFAVSTVIAASALATSAVSAILTLFGNGLPPGLVQTVRNNEYDIGSLKIEIAEMRNLSIITGHRLDDLKAKTGVLWALRECDLLRTAFQAEMDKAASMVSHLFTNRLAHDLVDPDLLQSRLRSLYRDAKKRNLYPAIEGVSDLFQLPTSFITFKNATIRIITEIPLKTHHSTMTLRKLGFARILMGKFNIQVPHTEMPYLATSEDGRWFKEVSVAELLECHKIRDVHYCPHKAAIFKDTGASCLMNLWRGLQLDSATLVENCRARVLRRDTGIDQIAVNLYVVEAQIRFDVTVHCGPNHKDNEVSSHQGTIVVQLSPGCVGQTFFGRFAATEVVAQTTIFVSPAHLNTSVGEQLAQLENWEEFDDTLDTEDRRKGILVAKMMKKIEQRPLQWWAHTTLIWQYLKDGLIVLLCLWVTWSICKTLRSPSTPANTGEQTHTVIRLREL